MKLHILQSTRFGSKLKDSDRKLEMSTSSLVRQQSALLPPKHLPPKHVDVVTDNKAMPKGDTRPYTINDLLVGRALSTPDAPLLAYPATSRGQDDYIHYTGRDLDRFADEAIRRFMSQGLMPKDESKTEDEVVAILAPSSLDYIVTIFALSRMGFSLLLLSNRLATEAYVSLLQKTRCHRMVTTATFDKSVEAIKVNEANWSINAYPFSEKSHYDIPIPSGPYYKRTADGPTASEGTAFIIHSSGSTGLPKPIFQTHKACLANYSSGLDYCALLTLPLYHNHGLSCFFRALYSGYELALFNANLPLTSGSLVAAMESFQPGGFHGVPYTLKLLGESERGMALLRACKVVMFGGSSCPDDLGDRLVDSGVYLVGHYGATEIGQIMTSFRPDGDKAWNYCRPIQGREKFLHFAPCGPNTFELVVLNGLPSKVISNSDDPPNSFRTSDIWTPHPTIPNAWKYLGRLDDRITLINGEKVLPIPFEHRVRTNDYVQEAWMFGIGRTLPGIMVVPSLKANGLSDAKVFENIWPNIEAANSRVEKFSQVSKEMTEVLGIGTEYP
jgi:acyl-CoA synthetase (AMP-forming)/AMP-acid ligase II